MGTAFHIRLPASKNFVRPASRQEFDTQLAAVLPGGAATLLPGVAEFELHSDAITSAIDADSAQQYSTTRSTSRKMSYLVQVGSESFLQACLSQLGRVGSCVSWPFPRP